MGTIKLIRYFVMDFLLLVVSKTHLYSNIIFCLCVFFVVVILATWELCFFLLYLFYLDKSILHCTFEVFLI